MHTHTHVHTHNTHAHTHVHTHTTHMHTHTRAHTRAHTQHTCKHIHTHTHTHTPDRFFVCGWRRQIEQLKSCKPWQITLKRRRKGWCVKTERVVDEVGREKDGSGRAGEGQRGVEDCIVMHPSYLLLCPSLSPSPPSLPLSTHILPSRVVQDVKLSNEAHGLGLATLQSQLEETQATLKSSVDAMEALKVYHVGEGLASCRSHACHMLSWLDFSLEMNGLCYINEASTST